MPHRCCAVCGEELSPEIINAHHHTAQEVEKMLLSWKEPIPQEGVALTEEGKNPRP